MKNIIYFCKNNLKLIIIVDIVMLIMVSVLISLSRDPAKIEGVEVTDTTYSSVSLKWNKSENAKHYGIYRSNDGARYKFVGTTSKTKYTDNNLTTGKTYRYVVIARNVFKHTKINESEMIAARTSLDVPKLKVNTSEGVAELKYSSIDGATGYAIFRDGELVGTSKETTYVDANAGSNKKHIYTVRAYRYNKSRAYSSASNTISVILHGIENLKITPELEEMIISWNDSEYYDSYKIYKGKKLLEETSQTSYRTEYDLDKTYNITVQGYNTEKNNKSPVISKKFKIIEKPMNNEEARQAACDWGVRIAEDDSFSYGTGRRAHRYGCYFCQTNTGPRKSKKGKGLVNGHSYEKTYCCNPFVHACYAHGAGDRNMLSACRNGRGIGMEVSSFTRYGNWIKVGKPAIPDLQVGDVLVYRQHVMLYIGDGNIVHAKKEGWGPDTITTDRCSAFYGRVTFVMRYTGNGAGTQRVVQEIESE